MGHLVTMSGPTLLAQLKEVIFSAVTALALILQHNELYHHHLLVMITVVNQGMQEVHTKVITYTIWIHSGMASSVKVSAAAMEMVQCGATTPND